MSIDIYALTAGPLAMMNLTTQHIKGATVMIGIPAAGIAADEKIDAELRALTGVCGTPINGSLHIAGLCREIAEAFNVAAAGYEKCGNTGFDNIPARTAAHDEADGALIAIHAKLGWVLDCLESTYSFDDEVPYTDVTPYPEDSQES